MNPNGVASSSKVEEGLNNLSLETSSKAKEEKQQHVECSSSEPKKLLKLKTSDGEVFEVEEAIMLQSETIKHMIEDGCADDEIPLLNISGNILKIVIEYCKKHVGDELLNIYEKEELKQWDWKFIEIERIPLFYVLIAANFLGIKGLLDLGCKQVGKMMKGKNCEQVREMFGIVNDFTPEEEAELRNKNKWRSE
ncbi:hypothetical protein AQUCO_00200222v1 [Aquilegia coerulea]|uniref:SKP1-like protein n=1 Tax=Aquilegia coerulea TaxID=218851 RepID=A0A2G5F288_AQUCA|nr:hypothetical protein AQUCO_00200222v1 [Aquilegia coerulea]PIA62080.1 hypothetical protein AQUCO_00200222v1 [Aquilegia coerulea]